jgi:hypothetical protein
MLWTAPVKLSVAQLPISQRVGSDAPHGSLSGTGPKCRKYVDPDQSRKQQQAEAAKLGAEVEVKGPYDDNPTGR